MRQWLTNTNFKGRAPLSEKYDNAMKWANTYSPEDFPRLTQACVLLFEMPSIVLLESTLLESSTQSRIVSSWLPKQERVYEKRLEWRDEFKTINLGIIRTFALLSITALIDEKDRFPITSKYFAVHPGNPATTLPDPSEFLSHEAFKERKAHIEEYQRTMKGAMPFIRSLEGVLRNGRQPPFGAL